MTTGVASMQAWVCAKCGRHGFVDVFGMVPATAQLIFPCRSCREGRPLKLALDKGCSADVS